MSNSSINPFKRIKDLEARICCLVKAETIEDAAICITETYTTAADVPVTVGVGLTYTVTVTFKGIAIVTTFVAGTTRATILSTLNTKFLTFKGVFTAVANKLQMVVTENLEGCANITIVGLEA